MMNKPLFSALLCALLAVEPVGAQTYKDASGTVVPGVVPLIGCTSIGNCLGPVSSSNPMPVTGTFSASLGGFTPSASGARMTALSVTTADSSGSLPSGAVVVVSNVGTTNPMYCNVNAVAATTSDQLIPASSWFAFTIPATITTLHCIATGGTTTADGLGGAGLPTGAGGGGSGGGGGGTSVADNAAWTAGTTAQTPAGCEYTSGGATALTTGHVGTPGCTIARGLFTDLESVGGTAFGAAMSNLGTIASGTPATLNINNYMVGCASTVCNANVEWNADGVANTTNGAPTTSLLMASNGTTVDRLQDDANKNLKVVLPSTQAVADPCMFQAKTKVAFSTTSGSTQLVALSGSTKIYVCAVHFITTSADSISFTEGTGTACATGATAVSGSTTAASGMDFPALGGMTEGGGVGTVMNTAVAGDELCLLQSGTTKIAGNLEVVQQ